MTTNVKTRNFRDISTIQGYKGKNLVYLNSNSPNSSLLAYQSDLSNGLKKNYSPWKLQGLADKKDQWLFGYLSYDLKNNIEDLTSVNCETISFSDRSFFIPDQVTEWKGNALIEHKGNGDLSMFDKGKTFLEKRIDLVQFTSKEEYLSNFDKLMFHIKRGDVYEINYCIEWFADNASIDPYKVYDKLDQITKAPFSCFVKRKNKYILCGSPERYLKREGNKIFSQPIKGTSKRLPDPEKDKMVLDQLINSIKERAENVMTTDVVRNDLSRVAAKNSVVVEELAKAYSFETVHHLISTISAVQKPETTITEILKATFPMASMTGAPKISAMKIIDEVESFKRGVYSGSVGYIKPNGDLDFNVVIRSILYDDKNKKLSFSVGGAITSKSDPEKEYEECLIKADAMKEALK